MTARMTGYWLRAGSRQKMMIVKKSLWCFQEMYSFPFIRGGYCLLILTLCATSLTLFLSKKPNFHRMRVMMTTTRRPVMMETTITQMGMLAMPASDKPSGKATTLSVVSSSPLSWWEASSGLISSLARALMTTLSMCG